MNAYSSKLQELGRRLVDREVYYCASSLMDGIGKIMWSCENFKDEFGVWPDDMIQFYTQDDYEEPVRWFIREDADLDDLETIVNKYADWDEFLSELGIPEEVEQPTHWVCSDCILPIVNGDYTAVPEGKEEEMESAVDSFEGGEYLGEQHDEEFSNKMCDCCGTTLAGARFAFSDGSDPTADPEERIKFATHFKGVDMMEKIREAVVDLVDGEACGYQEVAEELSIDPDQREVYEHWIVSDWLAGKLADRGEVTGDFAGLTIWGRCTTGQAIAMDGVIQQIAAELWKEELEEVRRQEVSNG